MPRRDQPTFNDAKADYDAVPSFDLDVEPSERALPRPPLTGPQPIGVRPWQTHLAAAKEDAAACFGLSADSKAAGTARGRLALSLAALEGALAEHYYRAAQGPVIAEFPFDFPRLATRVDSLVTERRRLLQALRTVAEATLEYQDSLASAAEHAKDLLRRVRAAEAEESEILYEAYYVDIGASD